MDWNSLDPDKQKVLAGILLRNCKRTEIDRAISMGFRPSDSLDTLTRKDSELPAAESAAQRLSDLIALAVENERLGSLVKGLQLIKLGSVTFRNLADLVEVGASEVSISGIQGFEFQGAANRLGIVDFDDLLKRLAEIKEATCRFILPQGESRSSIGTGVLVAEDLVLTNCHVLEAVIGPDFTGKRMMPPAGFACEFGYSSTDKSSVVAPLAASESWVIALSPKAANGKAAASSPTKDLDYALVRLAAHPALTNGQKRCFEKPANIDPFEAGVPILVVHYPGQERLSASFGKTVQNDGAQTRVRYDADTEAGTSGSGVYRLPKCSLISLHQGANRSGGYNQGIPIQAILQDSLQRGKQ
ncbi:serine protease [Mesorhizobium sp. WSM3859]|uniref:trypsin-like serine peptidase n=1 Tax=Mesorhizobium sp. WSM3859 TaxID=2029402 RepID=UPI000BAFF9DC|nr:serine protease [Mesorhizobium sp. WSM3859]PBC08180.1 hypothetical protein CK230_21955 [Mesorhizobium sp. WSM3859]